MIRIDLVSMISKKKIPEGSRLHYWLMFVHSEASVDKIMPISPLPMVRVIGCILPSVAAVSFLYSRPFFRAVGYFSSLAAASIPYPPCPFFRAVGYLPSVAAAKSINQVSVFSCS